MKTPTLEQFQAWARDNHDLAMSVVKAQAYAGVMREQVDKIQRDILKDIALYDDMGAKRGGTRERISDPKLTYLSTDEPALQRYYAECNKRERAAGLKPAGMPDDYCPALVAEDQQRKVERALLDSGGALFGFGADQLVGGDLWERGLKLMLGGALKETDKGVSRRPQAGTLTRGTSIRPRRQGPPRLSR